MSNDLPPRLLSLLAGRAETAVVLGSGLSSVRKLLSPEAEILYGDIPGFPIPAVKGHPGRILLVKPGDRRLLVFAGRLHFYEYTGPPPKGVVGLAARLGCRRILLTQAAGSLRPSLPVGSWLLPADVVSLPVRRPGGEERREGALRFPRRPLICDRFRKAVAAAASRAGIPLREGILFWASGPDYETPAMARAAVEMGADAATMSPLPELIEARRKRIDAACLSWITNFTPPISRERMGHEKVIGRGEAGAQDLLDLMRGLSSA
ncbi:MAG: purine-nucleoside phosphorylase [Candidatus Krumholzibacteriota bacterium]|nr:purine-nucleoside phosphorylase [Candidatus Krumholzibacteriota bacterium]